MELTALETIIISLGPALTAIISMLFMAIKIVKAYRGIEKDVSLKADKETVERLIKALEEQKKEDIQLRKVMQIAIEKNIKIKYEDMYDEEGNRKV